MAIENKDIGDIVKKCKILLLDIEGTTTSISFVKDKLFPYAEQNVKQFLDSQWENDDVKDVVAALRKLSLEDQESSVEGVVVIPGEDAPKEEQIEGLVKSVKWQMSADRKAGPLKHLQGLIWKQGYDNGDIKGHVYDDVSAALEAWHSAEDQKVYIYSSGSVQAQKLLFGQSLAGDLLKYIDGHFDTAVGMKQDAVSYTNIAEKIACKPEEILFLTDIVKEAEAAQAAGLCAALVSREGNAPLPAVTFPVLHSLAELIVSNKRKPEQQEEEAPAAKILKTDTEVDVKSATESAEPEAPAPAETTQTDKMEVEQDKVPVKEQVVVEELESNEGSIGSVIDVEPAAVEHPDENKEEKTEQKDIEIGKEISDKSEPKANQAAEEKAAPAVVMEVEEVTEDKLLDEAEVVEDMEPVIEEPDNAEDMEQLKNVGDDLEKECDEILSKVKDVTNLDNITVKPLLNPIAEEAMETENTDSNDIVNRILDTEMDLEMKKCADIDTDAATEITKTAKTDIVEENGVKEASHIEKKETVTETISKKEEEVTEKEKDSVKTDETVSEKKEALKEQNAVAGKEEVGSENTVEKDTDSRPVEKKADEIGMVEEKTVEAEKKESNAEESSVEVTEPQDNKNVEDKKLEDVIEKEKVLEETKPMEPTESSQAKAEAAPNESTETEEPQLNGSTANGDSKAAVNGDASKEEELSARLTDGAVENGKVNGANGDSSAVEKGQGDCKLEDAADIKVKSVPTGEPRTDPIEQPTEA